MSRDFRLGRGHLFLSLFIDPCRFYLSLTAVGCLIIKLYIWIIKRLFSLNILDILPYLPTSPLGQDMTRGQFLSGLNSEFSFSATSCLAKEEEPSLLYYLPIAGGRIIGFIPFPRVLVLCEMQSASSRIWTRVAVSISYDDNHYTSGTSYWTY